MCRNRRRFISEWKNKTLFPGCGNKIRGLFELFFYNISIPCISLRHGSGVLFWEFSGAADEIGWRTISTAFRYFFFHIGDGIELSLANPTRQFMLIASRCKLIWEPLKSSIRDALCFTHFHPHYSVWGMYTVRIFTTPGHTLFLLWVYINLHVLDIYTVYAWGEENPGLLLTLLLVVATSGRKEENRNENLSETVSTTAVTISGVTHISHSGSDFRRVLSHFYCLCLVLRHHPTSPSFGIGWAPDLKRWNNR